MANLTVALIYIKQCIVMAKFVKYGCYQIWLFENNRSMLSINNRWCIYL